MAEYLSGMPLLPLTSDMRVQFEAVSPTDGSAVSGVTVSQAVIYAQDMGDGAPGDLSSGSPSWVWGDSTVQV